MSRATANPLLVLLWEKMNSASAALQCGIDRASVVNMIQLAMIEIEKAEPGIERRV